MDLKPWLDSMTCTVLLHDDFADEMVAFDEKLQDELFAHAKLLAEFGPQRQAVLLVGGDKGGADQKRFYKRLIAEADNRYSEHLATLDDATVKEPKNGKKTQ